MMRVIWTLLLIGAAWWVVRRWSVTRRDGEGASAADSDVAHAEDPQKALAPAPMVRCAHCGVHLPESDAVLSQGRRYCSPAHRDAAERVA